MSSPKIVKSTRVNLSTQSYAHMMWETMDTATSLSCYILSREGEFEQLVTKRVSPLHYVCPLAYFLDNQAVRLLSKYPFIKTGINTKLNAEKRFIRAEVQCKETNERFRNFSCEASKPRVSAVMLMAQQKIAQILGDVPEFQNIDFGFGPGAAFGVRGDTSLYKKVTSTLECTTQFISIAADFLAEFPGWISPGTNDVNIVLGSEMTMVPKDATTDRSICIEPLLNGLYQKGFGSYIRKRLQRFGVDLDDQSINQRLARLAYEKRLATIDFSMASDTISYGLVLSILPPEWFDALNVARSPKYKYGDAWYDFQKFTSMGNGYTFELESLIFFALAYACTVYEGLEVDVGNNIGVYGDDVIIPQAVVDLFQEVTEFCGLQINKEKSFTEGVFFESCGSDFFLGYDVRPTFLKRKLSSLLPAYHAANSIFRTFKKVQKIVDDVSITPAKRVRDFNQYWSDPVLAYWRYGPYRFSRFHDSVVSCIPVHLRPIGPEGYGDGHLVGAIPSTGKGIERHPSWDGWYFRTYIERPKSVKIDGVPMGYALYFNKGLPIDLIKINYVRALPNADEMPGTLNGTSYSLRGKTVVRQIRTLCHFVWHSSEFAY